MQSGSDAVSGSAGCLFAEASSSLMGPESLNDGFRVLDTVVCCCLCPFSLNNCVKEFSGLSKARERLHVITTCIVMHACFLLDEP